MSEPLTAAEVVRMLEGIRRDIEVMGEDGECSLRTIRGVQYVTKDDAMLAVDDRLGVMRFRAAADSDIATTDVRDAIAHDWTVTTEQQKQMTADLDALISRAAARAVDEALSVERVAEALHKVMGHGYHGGGWDHGDGDLAAALVAHLRGPR
jgi:hypothetical protein